MQGGDGCHGCGRETLRGLSKNNAVVLSTVAPSCDIRRAAGVCSMALLCEGGVRSSTK